MGLALLPVVGDRQVLLGWAGRPGVRRAATKTISASSRTSEPSTIAMLTAAVAGGLIPIRSRRSSTARRPSSRCARDEMHTLQALEREPLGGA
jgi:hypothetical protein